MFFFLKTLMYFKRFVIKKYRLMLMVARVTIDTVRSTHDMNATNEQRGSPPIHLPVIKTTIPNGTQNRVASKSTTITFRSRRLCHVRRRGLVCIIKQEKMLPIIDARKISPNTIVSITTRYTGRSSKSLAALQLLTFMSTVRWKICSTFEQSTTNYLPVTIASEDTFTKSIFSVSAPWVFPLI